MDLSDIRVLAFATHGLMPGEFEGVNEPALVLTPPAKATEKDDGLLRAGGSGATGEHRVDIWWSLGGCRVGVFLVLPWNSGIVCF